ncbi:Sir2 family protein [Pleurostoma richardsiae]|uniref:Sir2 family protein n=1 Tax=Pleurostoma richardsiae TaxID=41990 RepID=A0AA38RK73_9PEZI|nr:Sir2 family protein [Pleurostoma richardsiae]
MKLWALSSGRLTYKAVHCRPGRADKCLPKSSFVPLRTIMASAAPHNDIAAFHEVLKSSKRILALCGAGLSASSGLPTFRGAGGLWRNYEATGLATPEAFDHDPGLVWLFYQYRRHMALKVEPNPGHHALAALAQANPDFLCLSQNVDGLSPRAGHPASQLCLLHGSLFDIKCFNDDCAYIQHENYDDPFFPALAPACEDVEPGATLPLLDPAREAPRIPRGDIPTCPSCGTGMLRPGVVWFGEPLDEEMLRGVGRWLRQAKVDLMLVVGTSAVVQPAASYIWRARNAGARVATINIEAEQPGNLAEMEEGDFAFGGDAAEILPKLFEPVIGKVGEEGKFDKVRG